MPKCGFKVFPIRPFWIHWSSSGISSVELATLFQFNCRGVGRLSARMWASTGPGYQGAWPRAGRSNCHKFKHKFGSCLCCHLLDAATGLTLINNTHPDEPISEYTSIYIHFGCARSSQREKKGQKNGFLKNYIKCVRLSGQEFIFRCRRSLAFSPIRCRPCGGLNNTNSQKLQRKKWIWNKKKLKYYILKTNVRINI